MSVGNQPDIVGVVEKEGIALRRDGKLFVGKCPFHADSTPSLKIFPANNSFYCFGCHCGGDTITFIQKLHGMNFLDACKYLGVEIEREAQDIKQRVVATYTYTDGTSTYYKDRIEPGKGGRSKEFRAWSMKDGERQYTRGCDPLIYNGDTVASAKAVVFVEGEKKADTINAWGLPGVIAVCLDSGSGAPWKPEYTEAMRGKEKVVILPDNDEPGEKYATMIVGALCDVVGEIKIVRLPGLAAKGDVVDWVQAGGTKEAFVELVKATKKWEPVGVVKPRVDMDSIYEDSLAYWDGIQTGATKIIPACTLFCSHVEAYMPKHINILSGYTSAGKSTALAQMLVELGRQGIGVDVFSLEDSREEKFMTMVAVMTGIHKRKMVLGRFTEREREQINQAAAEMIPWKINIYDRARSLMDIEKVIQKSENKIVCLDYVQNLFIDRKTIYDKMSFAAQEIFRMATHYDTTWNVLSQVSNDSMVNESDLMSLKGAGELAAIANSVMNMRKGRKQDNQHTVTLQVKKNKTFGPCGDVELVYSDCWTRLERVDGLYSDRYADRFADRD
jgi:5S rRNA maturation endonuclease (ribonuclease M5)